MRRSLTLPIVALVLMLTACSAPAAKLGSLSTEVALSASGGDPKVVEEIVDAHQGDVVRTDADGLAELTFADGSLTRVGPDTEYTVVEVSDAATQRTVGSLDVGSTFHRVEKLVGDDSAFEVQTPFGTAAVRGTMFAVTCTETACEIVVLEGEVVFTPEDGDPISILPFQRLVVPEGDEATRFPYDAVAANEWLASNLEGDELDTLVADVPEAGGLAGVWAFNVLTTESTSPNEPVGTSADREWTFSAPECDASGCTVRVDSSSGTVFDFAYDGSTLVSENSSPSDCVEVETGNLVAAGAFTNDFSWSIDASGAADGSMTGTRLGHTYVNDEALCPNAVNPDTNTTADVTLTRQ